MKRTFFLIPLFLILLLTACGNRADSGNVIVSGKDWTEQWILTHLLAETIKAHTDLEVEVKEGLGSETVLTEALKKGDIDLYVEYTGTGYMAILHEEFRSGMTPDDIYEATKKGYEEELDVTWLKPLGFANNHVMTMRKDKADSLGASKLGDLKGKAGSLAFGAPGTFYERADGYEGLTKAYGFQFGKKVSLDEDLMYQAVQKGEVDIITGFSTDPRIRQFDLAVLEDDKQYFPPYDAAPVVRRETLEAHPELKEALEKLAGQISTEEMSEMNAEVNLENKEPRDVAIRFLKKKGLIQ
ncbi:MAG: glycine betaine ABC transporter substrate-binding protein [Planifilum fimeticola]|jgi:osmoprotectant transport system substrate-binding protein